MQFIIELFLWLIIEVVFWGIMFWTGYTIISALTMGRWKLSIADREKQRKESRFIITALIGFLFWLGLGIAVIIFL